ncbi:glutathione peroxidase [Ralstonia mannitolilytica]|uniref:Glutathione peroxidase n=1 Tax=Ralstonia mannitolilytica TaxID=105219 RepID=A0AAJ4ZIP5_9RALS|nr:glutathione peroxidase [Ralstonia mannitolilytica]AJW44049.1 glutathione peroxidase [Ralstonia mannitolilytica]MBU9580305.1 glutathione peroxidase [Ralstonia mannitolilytica]QIF06420.1 glutathione peroxidase [Ralstonia mannitolilytica]CAG2153616.1 Thioredoxin/glutathione peroxidase BtuE [Ralstonia mannitolilytica]CAJ0726728.1 Thioredoxin/glutathione peroxidase BtuE [Ralstonia mannitolilytica]
MLYSAIVPARRRHLQRHMAGVLSRHQLLMIAIIIAIGVIALLLPRTGHAAPAAATAQDPAPACPASLNFRVNRLQDDARQDLCQYAGRVVLVVNTASYCGYTHQYEGLEALYARYRDKGLTVLGFPSNDFQQEPGNSKQIADFCYNTYGVKFPMFSKTAVVGAGASPLYTWLAAQTGQPPKWNFHKYLLDRNGRVAAVFPSSVEPTDPTLVKRIEALLAEPARASR